MSSKAHHVLTNKQYYRWQKAMRIGYKIFKCHQLPERSFFYHGMQFPMCARCTGIAIGFAILGPIITIFTLGNMYISMILIFLMIQDGLLQLFKVLESTNLRRLITGLGFGYAFFSIIIHIIVKFIEIVF